MVEGGSSLSSNNRKRRFRYPPSKAGFYVSIMTVVLSVILAFLLWETPLFLLYYFVSTFIIAVATFLLRTRLSRIKMSQAEQTLPETGKGAHRLKKLLLMFLALITLLALPLALAKVLDPYVWFTLLISFMTGLSVAEILFYLYTRRWKLHVSSFDLPEPRPHARA